MNLRILLPTVLFPFTAIHGQYAPPDPSGLQGIIIEPYYVADANDAADQDGGSVLIEGSVTYRMFVDLKPGYKLLTVGGFPGHPFTISSSTFFFNNDDRGEAWGDDINDIHLDKNTVAIDSWLSMGAASDAHWGVLKSADMDGSLVGGVNNDGGSEGVSGGLLVNDVPFMGTPLTTSDGLMAPSIPPGVNFVGTPPDLFDAGGANSYSNDNFAWAVLGGVSAPDTSNRILIGQFTSDGEISICLNLWVRIPDSLVCPDPNCHEIMEFYAELLPSDTAGGGFATQNKFTRTDLCFLSSALQVDCEGVTGGPALPGTACDDGNPDTANDVYSEECECLGEDCEGVLGGGALPGTPCDDGNPETQNDVWMDGCICDGVVGIDEPLTGTGISIRPNPTNSTVWLSISSEGSTRVTYQLTDMLGAIIVSSDLGTIASMRTVELDLSGLAQGTYLLNIVRDGMRHTEQIIKY